MKPFRKSDWDRVSKRNKDLLEEFIKTLSDKSPETVRKYRACLELWFVFLFWAGMNRQHYKVPPYMTKRFVLWLKEQGESEGTIAMRLSALTALNRYCMTKDGHKYHFFKKNQERRQSRLNGKKNATE